MRNAFVFTQGSRFEQSRTKSETKGNVALTHSHTLYPIRRILLITRKKRKPVDGYVYRNTICMFLQSCYVINVEDVWDLPNVIRKKGSTRLGTPVFYLLITGDRRANSMLAVTSDVLILHKSSRRSFCDVLFVFDCFMLLRERGQQLRLPVLLPAAHSSAGTGSPGWFCRLRTAAGFCWRL